MKRYKTEYPGVRYKEHETRKHGKTRMDRYYSIYYRLNDKVIEEGLGWESQGMTAQKAALELGRLKEAQRLGKGPQTLKERRDTEKERRQEQEKRKEEETQKAVTLDTLFNGPLEGVVHYIADAEKNKGPQSVRREKTLYELWLKPVIGNLPLRDITVNHVEAIKAHMMDEGLAPATVRYGLAVLRQVFNWARNHDLFIGDSPTRKVKKPMADNRRMRFLTPEEVVKLLETVKKHSILVHNICLVSATTGARLSEVCGLCWSDVDLKGHMLTLRNTKNGDTRHAKMTKQVLEMFVSLPRGRADAPVFPGRRGKDGKVTRITRVSRTFDRVVEALKLNDGITDPTQKVVFHSLRHSFASWARKSGADLFTLQRLLGHRTASMVFRYAHVCDETVDSVMSGIEQSVTKAMQSKDSAEKEV